MLAILTIAFGFLAMILGDAAVGRFRKVDCIYKHNTLYGCICAVLCTLFAAVGIFFFVKLIKSLPYEEHRYPAKDCRIETEVTTRGNVSDTTYIITRK